MREIWNVTNDYEGFYEIYYEFHGMTLLSGSEEGGMERHTQF